MSVQCARACADGSCRRRRSGRLAKFPVDQLECGIGCQHGDDDGEDLGESITIVCTNSTNRFGAVVDAGFTREMNRSW